MRGLCKMLLSLWQRNLRQSLWLANWSLLDWKTHFFSSTCFPLNFISSFFHRCLRLVLAPVQCRLVFLFPPCHFSVLLIFEVPFSVCPFIHSSLLLSAVSFSFTSTDLQTYSIAVSSLFAFHLPILTLMHPFWDFFSFVCLMLFLFWYCVCPNPCCNPLSAKNSFPTILDFLPSRVSTNKIKPFI